MQTPELESVGEKGARVQRNPGTKHRKDAKCIPKTLISNSKREKQGFRENNGEKFTNRKSPPKDASKHLQNHARKTSDKKRGPRTRFRIENSAAKNGQSPQATETEEKGQI